MFSLANILIILNSISVNHCEQWFSATVLETDKPKKEYQSGQIQGNEEKFQPIDVNIANHQFYEGFTPYRRNFIKRKQIKNEFEIESFQHNGTTEHIDIKNKKVKSKKIRKRCPEACYKKILRSNQTRTRFLEVFQVVQFDNDPCISSSGLKGTCLHEYECQSSGGTSMGSCADGYGTCCVTLLPCDSESSSAIGWFTNPDYPLPSSGKLLCAVALSKASDEITQIRLDFAVFELLPPTAGICQEDQFIVSGQNINNVIPILCGINTGQHVYLEVGESEGPIYLSIQTANPENRLFSIKVTQLTSTDELTAPPGCLQYFSKPKGYMESFNYRDRSDISIAKSSSYLNNLNYAMCIERVPASCSVTYTNIGHMQIVNYDTEGLPVIPPGQAGVEIYNCPSDWLLISATRLCGDRLNDGSVLQDFSLNAPITDNNAGPIVIWFRSDEGYVGRGFKIQYKQNLCMSA